MKKRTLLMKSFRYRLPFLIGFVLLLGGTKTIAAQKQESENISVPKISQSTDETNFIYPKGAYMTFEDFVAIKPTAEIAFKKTQMKNILSTNFQLIYNNGKRVKKPFAVSNGKELFVRVKHLKKQIESKYRGQPSDADRDYLWAYLVDKNFLYVENELISDYGFVAKFV